MNHANRFNVNSSWVEPRGNETHTGIDSQGTTTDDVYPLANNALVVDIGDDGATTGRGKFLVLRYNIGGVLVYSNFFHLSSYATGVILNATITNKTTPVAKAGNTGASGGTHLHWEILKSYSSATRLSINPRNFSWGSSSFDLDSSVYKNFSYNSSTKVISIVGYDTDVNVKKSVSPQILYKSASSSTWTSAAMNPITGTTDPYDYNYTLPYSNTAVDVMIAGRRASTEYWTYYPSKYYSLNNGASPIPSVTDSKVTVFCP